MFDDWGLITLTQPALLIAQPVGNIRGVVTDGASGQTLPHVTIIVVNQTPLETKGIVYYTSRTYETQLSPEFISHFTIGYKINRNKLAHELSLKMFNVTGSEEFGGHYYNYRTNRP